MGNFLPTPVTETFPIDDLIDGKIAYGASSMQGYRTTQEDAHLCLLDFDKDTYLFGVFDGHGGAEVAQYAAKKYPEFLKNNESYKNKDYIKALRDSFLEFDASLIKDDVYKELKILAGDNFSSAEEDEDMSSNLDALKEEAKLPLTELLERLSKGKSTGKKERQSKLKAQKSIQEECNSNSEQCSSSSKDNDQSMEPCSSSKLIVENGESSSNSKNNSIESTVSSTEEENNKLENEAGCSENSNLEQEQPSSSNSIEQSSSNNSKEEPTSTNDEQQSSSSTAEASVPSKKRVKPTQIAQKATFLEMLNQINDEEDSDDDSMEEDEEDEEDSEMYDSEDESEENEEEDDDDDESESEEEGENFDFFKNGAGAYSRLEEGPGKDSGCTAVIVLIKDQKLYVANAGDSRCVLSRLGKEIEMSYDHKPTSEIEYNRIKKAGGCVTSDGRVNGGLNLSRAFGDHSYKKNQELSLEEQMITALPDIKIIDLKPEEDDFIVIACDGIWNSMSSGEVVEYINNELKKEKKLSKICDSLFFNCLAEDTRGDGRGCDNQTCIIIKLRDLPTREELLNNVDNKVKADNKQEENNSEELKQNIKIINELNDNGKRKIDEVENSLNGDSELNKKTKSESE